jgi:hypothetical protein
MPSAARGALVDPDAHPVEVADTATPPISRGRSSSQQRRGSRCPGCRHALPHHHDGRLGYRGRSECGRSGQSSSPPASSHTRIMQIPVQAPDALPEEVVDTAVPPVSMNRSSSRRCNSRCPSRAPCISPLSRWSARTSRLLVVRSPNPGETSMLTGIDRGPHGVARRTRGHTRCLGHGAARVERPPLGPCAATRCTRRVDHGGGHRCGRADHDEQVELAAARLSMSRLPPCHSPTITVVASGVVAVRDTVAAFSYRPRGPHRTR